MPSYQLCKRVVTHTQTYVSPPRIWRRKLRKWAKKDTLSNFHHVYVCVFVALDMDRHRWNVSTSLMKLNQSFGIHASIAKRRRERSLDICVYYATHESYEEKKNLCLPQRQQGINVALRTLIHSEKSIKVGTTNGGEKRCQSNIRIILVIWSSTFRSRDTNTETVIIQWWCIGQSVLTLASGHCSVNADIDRPNSFK